MAILSHAKAPGGQMWPLLTSEYLPDPIRAQLQLGLEGSSSAAGGSIGIQSECLESDMR